MSKLDSLSQWLQIAQIVAPLALAKVKGGDKIAGMIPNITNGIMEAALIKGAAPADRKAHVMGLVSNSVAALNATGHVALDPTEINGLASQFIDEAVQVTNLIHKTVNAPPAVLPGVEQPSIGSDVPNGGAS